MLTSCPEINAAVTWSAAIPGAVPSGTRISTRYVSVVPGQPNLLSTSAVFPFTVTSNGELTTCDGLSGNGVPGMRPGSVGPRPVAVTISVSPARAGFAEVTGEKSPWKTAGPLAVVTISGQDIGIR